MLINISIEDVNRGWERFKRSTFYSVLIIVLVYVVQRYVTYQDWGLVWDNGNLIRYVIEEIIKLSFPIAIALGADKTLRDSNSRLTA